VIIFEEMATAHLARGAVSEASKLAKNGLVVLRETEFPMWLPRYEAIAKALAKQSRQPAVRAYLEEFAMTKRQFSSQRLCGKDIRTASSPVCYDALIAITGAAAIEVDYNQQGTSDQGFEWPG
jgi:hypothetical protein